MSDPVRTREEPPVREAEEEEVAPGPRLPGFAYPLIAVLFAAVLVWSFSRILLAVDKNQASAIALLMAMNLLVGAALIAYGGRVRRRPAAFPFLLVASLLLIAGGTVSAVTFGDRGAEEAAEGERPQTQAVSLEARELKFTQGELTLTAGAQIRMTFANEDAGTQHNFSLFNGPDASAPVVFRGSLNTGPTTVTYTFNAPDRPGNYFFQCDVHPGTMTGTVRVVPEEAGGEAAALREEAKGLKFVQPQLSVRPSGGQVRIHFVNSDAGTQHNIAVFRGPDATAPVLFRGELIAGPAVVDYTFEAPPPGTYFFHCDVHPTMTGTLTVT
jgi:plastocyanin